MDGFELLIVTHKMAVNEGNIEFLIRRGMIDYCDEDSVDLQIGFIDSLDYFYTNERLDSLFDYTEREEGFYPGLEGDLGTYGYDDNGNLVSDPFKKITMEYNYLNLPKSVIGLQGTMAMDYDVEGVKLKQEGVGFTTEYFGEVEYKDQGLDIIRHEEGLIRKIGGRYRYDYVIKDHLGNSRVTFTDLDADKRVNYIDEILQENHYYHVAAPILPLAK